MELVSLSSGYVVTCLSSLIHWLKAKRVGREHMNNIRVMHVQITHVTDYYYYYHHCLLYVGYLHTYSRDKPCP